MSHPHVRVALRCWVPSERPHVAHNMLIALAHRAGTGKTDKRGRVIPFGVVKVTDKTLMPEVLKPSADGKRLRRQSLTDARADLIKAGVMTAVRKPNKFRGKSTFPVYEYILDLNKMNELAGIKTTKTVAEDKQPKWLEDEQPKRLSNPEINNQNGGITTGVPKRGESSPVAAAPEPSPDAPSLFGEGSSVGTEKQVRHSTFRSNNNPVVVVRTDGQASLRDDGKEPKPHGEPEAIESMCREFAKEGNGWYLANWEQVLASEDQKRISGFIDKLLRDYDTMMPFLRRKNKEMCSVCKGNIPFDADYPTASGALVCSTTCARQADEVPMVEPGATMGRGGFSVEEAE